jgi:hypothetical protein
MRLWLARMDDVRELDCVLDEENWDIVPNDVPVALLGVKLSRETSHITNSVRAATTAQHRGEAHENGRFPRRICEHARHGQLRDGLQ